MSSSRFRFLVEPRVFHSVLLFVDEAGDFLVVREFVVSDFASVFRFDVEDLLTLRSLSISIAKIEFDFGFVDVWVDSERVGF